MEYVRELLTDMCVISPFKIFEYTDDDHEEFVIKSINDINREHLHRSCKYLVRFDDLDREYPFYGLLASTPLHVNIFSTIQKDHIIPNNLQYKYNAVFFFPSILTHFTGISDWFGNLLKKSIEARMTLNKYRNNETDDFNIRVKNKNLLHKIAIELTRMISNHIDPKEVRNHYMIPRIKSRPKEEIGFEFRFYKEARNQIYYIGIYENEFLLPKGEHSQFVKIFHQVMNWILDGMYTRKNFTEFCEHVEICKNERKIDIIIHNNDTMQSVHELIMSFDCQNL